MWDLIVIVGTARLKLLAQVHKRQNWDLNQGSLAPESLLSITKLLIFPHGKSEKWGLWVLRVLQSLGLVPLGPWRRSSLGHGNSNLGLFLESPCESGPHLRTLY